MEEKYTKIAFELEQDEYGWPPITTETLWAIDLGDGTYKVDNIPFHIPLLAYGDIITAEYKYDDILYYKSTIKDSQHSTIRIFFKNKEKIKDVYKTLEDFGCSLEGGQDYKNLTSVDIPPKINFSKVKDYLQKIEDIGFIIYEEPCISEHHRNQEK